MKNLFALVLILTSISSFAQKSKVIDTDFSKGQLTKIQSIEYKDLIRFHGHSCDGLLEGMQALQLGLKELYPNGVIDRTNTRIVSKSSPCLTDAAIYMTGGRYQYNTFYVGTDFNGLYIIQRVDNGKCVRVVRNDGVKPKIIDELGDLAIAQKLSYKQLQELRKLEDAYAKFLRKTPPTQIFTVISDNEFRWNPIMKSDYIKTDIVNKHKKIDD